EGAPVVPEAMRGAGGHGGGVPGTAGDADAQRRAHPDLAQRLDDAHLEGAAGGAAGEHESDPLGGTEEREGLGIAAIHLLDLSEIHGARLTRLYGEESPPRGVAPRRVVC